MESHASDVVRVAVKGHDVIRVRRLDIVELDIMMARRCQKALIGGDTETIHLGIRMLDCAGTDAR